MTTASQSVGVTGAGGFLGGEICRQLQDREHKVVGFSRQPEKPLPFCSEVRKFSPNTEPDLSNLDAVIHLAGENILGRWTRGKKERIFNSREEGTRRLVAALRGADKPKILLSASAIGYYGPTGDTEVTEDSPRGTGFLAEVTSAWEAETRPAEDAGVRVCRVRLGMVLGKEGGAMRLIRPIFRLGLGGKLGSGQQWMAPIHLHDAAGIFLHLLETQTATGIFNAVQPFPIRNVDFTAAVAAAARRPAFLPAPAFALRMVFGELSGLLLHSTRVLPPRLLQSGYVFQFSLLPEALKEIFSQTAHT